MRLPDGTASCHAMLEGAKPSEAPRLWREGVSCSTLLWGASTDKTVAPQGYEWWGMVGVSPRWGALGQAEAMQMRPGCCRAWCSLSPGLMLLPTLPVAWSFHLFTEWCMVLAIQHVLFCSALGKASRAARAPVVPRCSVPSWGVSSDKMVAIRGNEAGWDKPLWKVLDSVLMFGKNFSLSSPKNFLWSLDTEKIAFEMTIT